MLFGIVFFFQNQKILSGKLFPRTDFENFLKTTHYPRKKAYLEILELFSLGTVNKMEMGNGNGEN